MPDWLRWWFDTPFVTRDCCGEWTPGILSLYRTGHLLTWLSYWTMTGILVWMWWNVRRRVNLYQPASFTLLLFATFIGLCGTNHLLDWLASTTWPAYRLAALEIIVTGLVSCAVAVLLWPIGRHVLSLPTPDDLNKLIAEKETALGEKDHALRLANDALKKAVAVESELVEHLQIQSRKAKEFSAEAEELRQKLLGLEWNEEFQDDIKSMRETLHRLRGAVL